MSGLRRKTTEVLSKNFFLCVGAGMVITMLIPMLGGHLFIGWNSSEHTPVGERIFDSSLAASSSSSAVLADYDCTVQSLDGQDFKMAHTKGKVVFLNFWATW